jgi:hypothetical protein
MSLTLANVYYAALLVFSTFAQRAKVLLSDNHHDGLFHWLVPQSGHRSSRAYRVPFVAEWSYAA